jgi:AsmA protein
MKRPLKIFLKIILILVLLFAITAVTLPFVIDPNDYKDDIASVVKNRTGRELTIPGNISWSFFPWLGLELGEMQLSNAPGFKPGTFAAIKAMDIRIKVLPLLTGKVEIGQIVLDGLDVTLQRNANGVSNWDDLLQAQKPAPKKPQPEQPARSAPPAVAALAIAGLEVRQARVVWDDQLNRQYFSLNPFNLSVGKVALDTPVPVHADFQLQSRAPKLSGKAQLDLNLTANLQQQRFTFDRLQLQTTLNSPLIPGNQADARLASQQLRLNLAKQTLSTEQLTLQSFGIQLHTNVSASKILESPQYQASLTVDPFSPRALLKQLQVTLPPMADPRALQTAQLTTEIQGSLNRVALKKLFTRFDESELTGEVTVNQFSQPAIGFNLTLNQIDVDRYLPPGQPKAGGKAGKPVATPATAAAGQATLIPVDLVRNLNLDGTLRIARLKAMNLKSHDIRITTRAKNGRVRLHPLGAQLYDGNYSGDIRLDASGKTPRVALNENLNNVQIGPLLKDLWGDDIVRGQANLSANLTASGNRPLAIRKSLSGDSRFRINRAEIKDIDMQQVQKVVNDIDDDLKAVLSAKNLIEAKARADQLKQKFSKIKNPQANNATYLSDISGTVQIKDGLARNRDLRARLPYGRIRGDGSVDLVRLYSDYTAYIKLTSEGEVQSGQTYEQMDKTPLKIYFKGPLDDLTPQPDFGDYLSAESKKALDKAEQKFKQDLQKKVDTKVEQEKQKLEQKLEDKAGDLLKKLFK